MEEQYVCGCYNILPNVSLADLAVEAMQELGPIEFTDEERAYAQQIIDGFPGGLREQSCVSASCRGNRPVEALWRDPAGRTRARSCPAPPR